MTFRACENLTLGMLHFRSYPELISLFKGQELWCRSDDAQSVAGAEWWSGTHTNGYTFVLHALSGVAVP